MMRADSHKGQGAFEYLLLIAGVVLFAVVALLVLFPFSQESGDILNTSLGTFDTSVTLNAGFDGTGPNGGSGPGNNPPICQVPDGICNVSAGETAANCLADCHCGDAICEVNLGENPPSCSPDCTMNGPACGNNLLESPEECDDGNNINGDGCSGACMIETATPPVCGNTIVESGETCDDGNTQSGDGCSSTCQLESSSGLTYQYNAKFEPPVGRVIHGMGQFTTYNALYTNLLTSTNPAINPQPTLVSLANPTFIPAVELFFVEINPSHPWNASAIASGLQAYKDAGIIPHIGFTLHGNEPLAPDPQNPYYANDQEVADTNMWDSRIDEFIQVIHDYKEPVFVRIGPEFSGWWNGYHPYSFPNAYRKIVDRFRKAGVDNVAFDWCYHPASPEDFDEQNALGEWKWYPGKDVVDWFGIDVYDTGDISGADSTAGGQLTTFGKTKKFLSMANAEGKPVFIPETDGSKIDITSDPTDGQNDWSSWFVPFFNFVKNNPGIKGFNFVNMDWTTSSYYSFFGWKNSDITDNTYVSQQYLMELSKSFYLNSGERDKLNHYSDYVP